MPIRWSRRSAKLAWSVITLAVLVASIFAAVAMAKWTKITVAPKSPNVDTQTVTVGFKAPFNLKPGWRWDAILTVLSGGDLSCASNEEQKARRPARKGQTVKLRFTPEKSIESISGTKFKWCQAAADITITTSKGKQVGRQAGTAQFRFSP